MSQLGLFDNPPKPKPERPRTGFAETRHASWLEKKKTLGGQKLRIVEHFERLGACGATIAEMAVLVADGKSNRICQAIKDLRDDGVLVKTSRRRALPEGKASVVMVLQEYA